MTLTPRAMRALILGFGALLAAALIAGGGVNFAMRAPSQAVPGPARQPAPVSGDRIIRASSRAEAESAAMSQLLHAADRHGVRVRSATFTVSPTPNMLQAVFEAEGPPAAIWRAVHDLETGQPSFVFERVRANVSEASKEELKLTATVHAAWLPPTPRPESASNGEAFGS